MVDPDQADLGSAMPTSGGLYWYAGLLKLTTILAFPVPG